MFDRNQPSYHDIKEIDPNDLPRFDNDSYATKYLASCYNPEFKVRVTFLKNEPRLIMRGGGIGGRNRKFFRQEGII